MANLIRSYFSHEMDRIKRDLMQLRDKNGIYIAQENYLSMLAEIEQNEIQISEKTKEMIALKDEMERKKALFDEVEKNMIYKSREIQKVKEELDVKEAKLTEVSKDLKKTVRQKEEQEHLVSKHMETEHKLGMQSKKLLVGCDDMEEDLGKLHEKLQVVKSIDAKNDDAKKDFDNEFTEVVSKFCSKIEKFGEEHEESCNELKENLKTELSSRASQISDLVVEIESLLQRNNEIETTAINEVDTNETKSRDLASRVGSLEAKVVGQEESRGKNYIAKVAPNLQRISDKVIAHAKALEVFKINMNANFDKIRLKLAEDTKKVVFIVKDMDKIVKENFHFESKSVEEINSLNEQVLKSHQKMKESLKSLDLAYNEHNSVVLSLTDSLGGVVGNLANKISPLKKDISSNAERLDGALNGLKEEVTKSVEENEKQTRKSVEECAAITEELVATNNDLKTSSSSYVAESSASVEEVFDKVEEAFEERTKIIEQDKLKVRERTKGTKDGLKSSQKKIDSKIPNEKDVQMESKITNLITMSNTNVEEIKENVEVIKGKVSDLVSDGIEIYKPSGETPARTERQYPRYLAATSPHQRILDRFRRAVEAEEAAGNAVEDSVDSAVSDSFRTNNTTAEDVPRDRTGSFSSDISGANDLESVASSSVSKTRELKKPAAIKRNILGKLNK